MSAIREILKRAGLANTVSGRERECSKFPDELVRLRRENEALRAQSEAQSQLFAAAVHDLRQPMQAMMLFSEVFSDEVLSPEQQSAALRMCRCVDALERLSSGMLDLCQLDTEELRPHSRELDLAGLLDGVDRTFHPLARERGLRLIVRPTDLIARGDATMLTRVLNNLVSNALYNTQQGGVLVGARREGDGVRIDVCDTGEGLVRELRSTVSAGVAAPSQAPREAQAASSGLGLATVRHLAERVGARIGLRCTHGRGTTVSIHLPA